MHGRNGYTLAATAAAVVLYGGSTLGEASNFEPLADGEVLDLATLRWHRMATDPFPQPLFLPVAGSNGTDVLVVGTLCHNKQKTDEDDVRCDPGSIAAAVYDPRRDAWRSLDAPPVDARPGTDGFAIDVLFVDDSTGTVRINDSIWFVDLASGKWTSGPSMPTSHSGGCATDDGFVAFTTDVVGDRSQDDRHRAPRLDKLQDGKWTSLFADENAPTVGSFGIDCLAHSILVRSDDVSYAKLVDAETGAARPVAKFPGHLRLPNTLSTGNSVLVWNTYGGYAARYDPASDRWIKQMTAPSVAHTVWTGQWVFFQTTHESGSFFSWSPEASTTPTAG